MDKIDKVFYINLEHMTDRRDRIEGEFEKYGITNYERFPAIRHKCGAVACGKSHLAILNIAKERGYKRIIILEDDVEFLVSKEDFHEKMNELKDVYYDVCLLSNEWTHIDYIDEWVHNKLHISQRTLLTSGYIVTEWHYDHLIRELELTTVMFDLLGVDWMTYMDFAWNQLQSKLNIRMLLLDRFTEEWL